MEQTSSSDMMDATRWESCEREDTAMLEFRRTPIVFGGGVEPTRLRGLLYLLAALTQLVGGAIWDECRRKIYDLPPYCTSCARFGQLAAACRISLVGDAKSQASPRTVGMWKERKT